MRQIAFKPSQIGKTYGNPRPLSRAKDEYAFPRSKTKNGKIHNK